MTQPVDSSILHEIVRVIESRRKVPEKVIVKAREYQLTYLEDHQRRLEEALMRYDSDRLNMLYGQLASKIKYQMLRRVPAKAVTETKPVRTVAAAKPAAAKQAAKPKAKPSKPSRKPKQKNAASKKAAARPSRARPRRASTRRK